MFSSTVTLTMIQFCYLNSVWECVIWLIKLEQVLNKRNLNPGGQSAGDLLGFLSLVSSVLDVQTYC